MATTNMASAYFYLNNIRFIHKMVGEVDIVVLPFMFVCIFVSGVLLNTCANKKRVSELEDEVFELQLKLSDTTHKLDKVKQYTDVDSSD
jgi:hypothetical protein